MDERMRLGHLCGIVLAATCWAAQAQALTDPTRPPSAQAPADAADASAESQLQSILLSRDRKVAVIGGQTVVLGGRIGDAMLVKISETSVVLKRGEEYETLQLLPGLDKKPSAARGARGRDTGAKP